MEIAGMVLCAAQTLFAALQCSEVKQICSILGCKSQLNDLSGTVVRIKAALEDAEAKQELSKQDRLFIEELKDAVYDADDLFDEFVTLAERKKLSKGIKVRVLALFGKYGTAYKMAQGVKMIKKKLDAIASDTRFNFNIDPKPIRNRRLESCSYVYEADIIGREPDLEKIVGVLLDPIVQQNYSGQLRFPRLKTLEVYRCPNLIAFMQCPALEDLTLHDFNKELEIIPMRRIKSKEFGEATPSVIPASSSSLSYDIGLKLTIDNVAWLNSLPMDSFLGVVELVIQEDIEVESLGEAKEVFCSYSSSLISLKIKSCSKLKSVVFGGLEHLTALENLEIENCSHLIPSEEVEREDGMPWQPVHHPLRSLYMGFLPRLVDLPNWTQYLTSLETLQIKYCKGLESVPNWMSELTSLKELKLGFSSERLIERCKQYTGEDWPHIEHIPEIRLYDNLKELRR
ncbi:hypothetical protein SOVF_076850 [Spinacia oleracea]|nr:hypothetical protein SOVF_076850 [Spinacia oleracea]